MNYFSRVDSIIKDHFRGKSSLIVMILVAKAFLIGLLTFLCLHRADAEETTFKDDALLVVENIKDKVTEVVTSSSPSMLDIVSETSYHVLGYVLHYNLQLISLILISTGAIFKEILLLPLHLVKYIIVDIMWILGCDGKQEETPVVEVIKKCLEEIAIDDEDWKFVEPALLLILSGILTFIAMKCLVGRPDKRRGETILLINSKGDWEYAPSNKREAMVKF